MIPDPQDEEKIRRLLLGEVGDLSKEWTADEIELVEEELVDQYVRGELSQDEKRRFESHYLSQPGNRRKLQFAAALHRQIAKPRRTWARAGVAGSVAASIALAVMVSWKLATVTLYPGAVRDSARMHRAIGRVIPRPVRLVLIDPLQPGKFRIVLRDAHGAEVWNTLSQVEISAPYIDITLPVRDIPPGDYAIEIEHGSSKTPAVSYMIRLR